MRQEEKKGKRNKVGVGEAQMKERKKSKGGRVNKEQRFYRKKKKKDVIEIQKLKRIMQVTETEFTKKMRDWKIRKKNTKFLITRAQSSWIIA